MLDIHISIRLLAIIIPEIRIISQTTTFLITLVAIHEIDAVLGVSLDAFLGIAAHDECLVEIAEMAVPICAGAVEG